MESHLLQMRGLKLFLPNLVNTRAILVASFTDAWIETLPFVQQWRAFGRIFYRCVD